MLTFNISSVTAGGRIFFATDRVQYDPSATTHFASIGLAHDNAHGLAGIQCKITTDGSVLRLLGVSPRGDFSNHQMWGIAHNVHDGNGIVPDTLIVVLWTRNGRFLSPVDNVPLFDVRYSSTLRSAVSGNTMTLSEVVAVSGDGLGTRADISISNNHCMVVPVHTSNPRLEQNYPNPFNPSTAINFSVPVSGPVRLKVFNLLGQEVETLLEQTLSSGWHSVEFNASAFASGTYIYRLETSEYIEHRRMILTK